MKEGHPQPVYLKDYTPPPYLITHVHLAFQFGEESTVVTSKLQVVRNPDMAGSDTALVLDGENLELNHVELDGNACLPDSSTQTSRTLLIPEVPAKFELGIQTTITPQTIPPWKACTNPAGISVPNAKPRDFGRSPIFWIVLT